MKQLIPQCCECFEQIAFSILLEPMFGNTLFKKEKYLITN